MPDAMLLLSVIFLVLLFAGIPVAYTMLLTSAAYFWVLNPAIPVSVIAHKAIGTISESFVLLAVPLFLLAGDLLNACGMTGRLVAFAVAAVGHIRGGLGHAVVVANIIMAGMSGSATADAAGIGSIMIPALRKARFRPAYAAALSASAATIGPIIPPSIAMVLYSSMSGVSLGRLLLAGVIPGLVMGLCLMGDVYFSRESADTERHQFRWRRLLATARDAVFALIMPAIILGGMFGGVYTPTEGAAVAVAYAVLIGTVVYQSLTLRMIFQSLRRVATMTAAVLIIVAASSSLSWVMSMEHAGDLVKGLFGPLQWSPVLTMLAIAAFILVLGTAMEENTMLVLFTPVLTPVVLAAGIDPVHFGLVFVLAIMMGLISPPVGISMFIACRIAEVSVTDFTLAVWRPFLALVVSLVIVLLFPQLVLFLPNLVMGR